DEDDLTREHDSNKVLGTVDYLAPEQAVDSHAVDIRADIYSLGVTLYVLLTGEGPFGPGSVAQKLFWHLMREPRPVREGRPGVPGDLRAVAHRMMAKARDQRYQTPAEVVAALAPWAQPGDALLSAPATPRADPLPLRFGGGVPTPWGASVAEPTPLPRYLP